jgi:hypothetical protein
VVRTGSGDEAGTMSKARECGDKQAFVNRQLALNSAMSRMRMGATRNDTNVYKCSRCGRYHIGHKKRSRR